MASALGSAEAASSINRRRVFNSARAKICNEWREGEVVLAPLPEGPGTIREDSAWAPHLVRGDAFCTQMRWVAGLGFFQPLSFSD
jgi:hypothetical protein